MSSTDDCKYGFEVVESVQGRNVTELDILAWPCQLREFWVDILPFVTLVRGLLSYGTSFIIALGLMFNSLSFIVLTRKHMRRSTTNLYLSVLATYDNLSLIMNFMIGVLRGQNLHINKDFQDHESLCKFHGVVVEVFNLLSVWVIVSFTIERFIMIKFPLKAKRMTVRRAMYTLIAVSLCVITFSLHKIAVSGFEGDSVYGYKACKTRRIISQQIIYFYVAFNTWMPTFVIVTFNGIIIYEIRKNQKKRMAMTSTSMSKSDEKATKLLLVVSSTYVILILPLGLVQTIELIWNSTAKVPPGHVHYLHFMITKIKMKWARAFFFFFYQFNFIINFFLYVTSGSATRFRATLRKLFGLKVAESEMTWTRAPTQHKRNAVGPAPASSAVEPETEQQQNLESKEEKHEHHETENGKDSNAN